MSDRREFLKTAGFLSLASWSNNLPAERRNADAEAPPIRASSNLSTQVEADAIVLENPEMRLVIGANGAARSLIHKASGQQCLAEGVDVAMFNLTQYRPYLNEVQLAYPAKVTHFSSDRVRREGDNLVMDLPVSVPDAVLGAKVEAPTPEGPVTLTVPKGSNAGSTLRLKGRGLAHAKGGGRGDLMARLQIVLPDKPDAELEQFAETWRKDRPYAPKRRPS